MDENFSKIMEQDSEIISFQFLKRNKVKVFFYYIGLICTLGLLYLPFYWFEHFNHIFYDKVEEDKSTHVLFQNKHDQTFLIKIYLKYSRTSPYEEPIYTKYVVFNNIKYQWDNTKKMWINIANIYTTFIQQNQFSEIIQPLEQEKANELQQFYGPNQIRIESKNNFNLFIDELLSPLNVYELVLIIICIIQQEWLYVYFLSQLIIVQIVLDIYFYKRKIKKINSIADIEQDCIVLRIVDGQQKKINIKSSQLCIGDIMLIQPKQKFTCDSLILKGACLIDQSVLTGESIPINKQKIEQDKPITSINKILAGSKCIILRTNEVQALILRTSWNTYKGKLVGKIVQQKKKKFKFYYELRFFIILIAIGYVSLAIYQFINSYQSEYITLNENIMITIEIVYDSFSPVLFFVLTTIYHFISFRLEEKEITAINTEKLQECGRVKNICFDKTGTLTENDIEIFGLSLMNKNELEDASNDMEIFKELDIYKVLVQLLACCQSLHVIDKQVIGDPIEEQMFKMTHFTLIEENAYKDEDEEQDFGVKIVPSKQFAQLCEKNENFCLKIQKNLDFTSERKRMSTIVTNMDKSIDSKYLLLSKGAPEIMKSLFQEQSIPNDYNQQVKEFSEQGLRLLAMGYKPIDDMEQDDKSLEKDMIFIGFILLDNKIKPETFNVIQTLQKNDVDCAMITGDNIYTGISIGYQSGILQTNKDIWVGEFDQTNKKIKWIQYNNMDANSIKFMNSKRIKSTNVIRDSIFQSKISQIKSHIGVQNFNYIKESLLNEQTTLALEGSAFEKLMDKFGQDEQIRELILKKTKIYGRAIPYEKQLIIKMLKKMYEKEDFCVGFVGDGSNDAKALNEANMGLSIGNSDSSLTASFTTTIDNIFPCIRLLREGKLVLDNSIQIYKFSVYEGFSSTFVIFLLAVYERNYHYIYFIIEFLIFMPLYILCANSRPAKLNYNYPDVSLKTKEFMTTLFGPLITIIALLTLLGILIFNRDITKSRQNIDQEHNNNHIYYSTAVFFIFNNLSQSIMLLAYNKSRPFKKGTFDNKYMLLYIFISSLFMFSMMFHFIIEQSWIGQFMLQQFLLPDFMNYFSLKIFIFLIVATFLNFTFVCTLNVYFLNDKILQRNKLQDNKKKQFKVQSEKWSDDDKSN